MKILWHSNAPWASTGYGQQTALTTTLIQEVGHDVAISAFWGLGGRKLEWNGMPVFPSGPDFGDAWLPAYAVDWFGNPDGGWIVTLMDVWALKHSPEPLNGLHTACWTPVDHDPLSAITKVFFERVPTAVPIAMSKFGQDAIANALDRECLYAPHAVDTTVFRPYDQADARAEAGIPADAFVIGMVANNQGNAPPRKAFPQVLEAFVEFRKRHDDAFLFLHTRPDVKPDGLDLPFLAKHLGMEESVMGFSSPYAMQVGIEQDKMAQLYSTFDVLASPSYGEGFGIPIIEAQAVGCPVIVNDFTAMPELVGDGWVCEGERWWDMSQGSYFKAPNVSSILECLEEAYKHRGGGSVKAREFALGYDARKVFAECWVPILNDLEGRMDAAKVPAVALNRKARRRKVKA